MTRKDHGRLKGLVFFAKLAGKTLVWAIVLLAYAPIARRKRGAHRLFWGPVPMINIKYISDTLRQAGWQSDTVVTHSYDIFKSLSFDRYYSDLVADSQVPGILRRGCSEYVVFLRLLQEYDVAHIPFSGGPLGTTSLAWLEPHLLRWAGIRVVMVPYGADFFRYSWIPEALVRHAMLLNYPEAGRQEDAIESRVKRWMKHADIVLSGFMVEGAGRWDAIVANFLMVPAEHVRLRSSWGRTNGRNGPVTILHAPNHRGVKGTEFIIEAVRQLKQAGHQIEFILLENMPNEIVLEKMRQADICVDQCIGIGGYGLFAIEAMASGATVMCNLEDEQRLGVHRHFGWLNQCPIVSANIDQLCQTLEFLICNPELRQRLGQAGVEYVRRFHSSEMIIHLFGAIYRKLSGEDIDLLRLFHPITSQYMRQFEPLQVPLRRNRPIAMVEQEIHE